jgi:RimK family alpha-L-glutamate ligase
VIAIVGSTRNETNVDLVCRWRDLGLDARLLNGAEAQAFLGPGDVAVGRLDVTQSIDGVQPGLVQLLRVSTSGVRVLNRPRALVNAHDKLRTARVLERAGLPHIRTEHLLLGQRPKLPPPLVVKPRFGSWGKEVTRCDTSEEIDALLRLLPRRRWFQRHGAVVQPFVMTGGRDLRLILAGGHAVGAEARMAGPGEWRTNLSLGGREAPQWPTPRELQVAHAAMVAVGADLLGIDLVSTDVGPVVIEVNGAVEFDDSYSSPDGDVFEETAEALGLIAPAVARRAAAVVGGTALVT